MIPPLCVQIMQVQWRPLWETLLVFKTWHQTSLACYTFLEQKLESIFLRLEGPYNKNVRKCTVLCTPSDPMVHIWDRSTVINLDNTFLTIACFSPPCGHHSWMVPWRAPGCVKAAGKARQEWQAGAVTKFTKPGDRLLAAPCTQPGIMWNESTDELSRRTIQLMVNPL